MPHNGPIVLATDLTARSDRPFDRALMLARQGKNELAIVHVFERSTRSEERMQEDKAREALDRLVRGTDVRTNVTFGYGSTPETVSEIAHDLNAAIIVVGAARYNNVSDFILGTAVDHLVRNAEEPVLVVKERPTGPYDRILVAIDFSEGSREAVKAAASLFPESPLTLVHAYSRPFPYRLEKEASSEMATTWAQEDMTSFLLHEDLKDVLPRLQPESLESSIPDALARLSRGWDNPLVVIGSHGLSGMTQALLGSRASEILSAVSHDILVVRKGISSPP